MEQYTAALAGNPNVGKSTVFNTLTGMRQHTGNWPGKTVAVAEGAYTWQGAAFRLIDLLRRPQVSYDDLRPFDPAAPELPGAVREQVEISVKYEGYIRRQQRQVEDFEQLEKHALPDRMDYSAIQGLRLEAREKLDAVRPLNLGQASRISGVSPADVGALMIWLQTHRDKEE